MSTLNRFFLRHIILLIILALIMPSCSDENGGGSNQDDTDREEIELYLSENNLTDSVTMDASGIYYRKIYESPLSTSPSTGDVLSIYYSANALNIQPFDAVLNNGSTDPVKLQYNTNSVFPIGLDICFGLLNEGDSAVFYIPSSLAYGDRDDLSSIIPANSVIEAFIKLVSIEAEENIHNQELELIESYISDSQLDSTIIDGDTIVVDNDTTYMDLLIYPMDSFVVTADDLYYKRRSEGISRTAAVNGQLAQITYEGLFLDSTRFDIDYLNLPFEFQYGVTGLIEGLTSGIAEMELNEEAILILPSRLGYGASAFVIPKNEKDYFVENDIIPAYASRVGPYEVLVFHIRLLNQN